MATPTFTLLNHQALSSADANTGWTDLTTADADIKVEGNGSMSGIFRADGEQGYYDAGTAPVTAVGKTVRGWIFTNNIAYMGTAASDGYKLLMYDGSTTELKTIFGSDTYPGGWYNYIWDCDDFTTLTLANVQRWGVESGHASNAKNATNTWMDVIRYLDGYSMTGGTSGDQITLADIAALDKTSAYGVCTDVNGVYFATGTIQFGTGATTTYVEMDGEVLVFTDQTVNTDLYVVSGVGTGTTISINGSLIKSVGSTTATRPNLDFDDADLLSLTLTNNTFQRVDSTQLKTGQTCTNNVWDNHRGVVPDGADISGSTFKNGQLAYDVLIGDGTDGDGDLDGCKFEMGGSAHNAIRFNTASATTLYLNDIDFSGYSASNNSSSSMLDVQRTAGTVTINLTGVTIDGAGGTVTYRTAGATVDLVVPSQVLTITGVPTGAEYRLYVEDVAAGKIGTTELQGAESWTGGNITYNYTWTGDVNVVLQVIEPGYVEYLSYFTLTVNSQTTNVVLEQETNT